MQNSKYLAAALAVCLTLSGCANRETQQTASVSSTGGEQVSSSLPSSQSQQTQEPEPEQQTPSDAAAEAVEQGQTSSQEPDVSAGVDAAEASSSAQDEKWAEAEEASGEFSPDVSGESEGTEQNSEEQVPTPSISSDFLLEKANTEYLPVFGRLINCEDWNNAEEIPVYMYYDWYRDYINSVTTHDERIERYTLDFDPDSPGWAYPAEEFEDHVKQHFAVSTEYLRGNDEVYLADKEVYWAGGGNNISYRTKVESDEDIQVDGEILMIRVACSLLGDFSDTIYKILVVDTSGGKINFVSCRTV